MPLSVFSCCTSPPPPPPPPSPPPVPPFHDDLFNPKLKLLRAAGSSQSSSATQSKVSFRQRLRSAKRKKQQRFDPTAALLRRPDPGATKDGDSFRFRFVFGQRDEEVMDLGQAIERIVKEDAEFGSRRVEDGSRRVEDGSRRVEDGSRMPPTPSASHQARAGTMTRFLRSKNQSASYAEDVLSSASDYEVAPPPVQPQHHRQSSSEFGASFFRAVSSPASYTFPSPAELANPVTPGTQEFVSTGPSPLNQPIPHRRQNSDLTSSMFSRMVRVPALPTSAMFGSSTANVDAESLNEQKTGLATSRAVASFLRKENGDTVSESALDAWRVKQYPDEGFDGPLGAAKRWTANQIHDYLFSPENSVKDATALDATCDMTRPMTEYFISTSHNTYLNGGQWITFGGRVDLQMYARALKQNCRCVEIDVYDGPDGDPIVTHYNPTVSGGFVTFVEVCALIARDAFCNTRSHSPMILNLENNMRTQTKRAAEILLGAFGRRLVRVDDPEFGYDKRKRLPTPEDFAGRVLCRSKPRDASEEYKNLIYLRNSTWRFPHVDEFFRKSYYQTSSLAENKVKGALKRTCNEVSPVELNHRLLNRVYPRPSAHASQNYNPLPYWLLGFQLVALNFQTEGIDMDLNRAMFERAAGTGFILKPPLMRRSARVVVVTKPVTRPGTGGGSSLFFAAPSNGLSSKNVSGSGLTTGSVPPSHSSLSARAAAGTSSPNFTLTRTSSKRSIFTKLHVDTNATIVGNGTALAHEANSTNHVSPSGPMTIGPLVTPSTSRKWIPKSFMGVVEDALKNQELPVEDGFFDNQDSDEEDAPPPAMVTSLPTHLESAESLEETEKPSTKLPALPPIQAAVSTGSDMTDSSLVSTKSSDNLIRSATHDGILEHDDDDMKDCPPPKTRPASASISHVSVEDESISLIKALREHSQSSVTTEENKKRTKLRRSSTGSFAGGVFASSTTTTVTSSTTSKASGDAAVDQSCTISQSITNVVGISSLLTRRRSLGSASESFSESTSEIAISSSFLDEETLDDDVFLAGPDGLRYAINSVVIEFLSVRCNLTRERNKHFLGSSKQTKSGGSGLIDNFMDDDGLPDEELFVELIVDGHVLDRIEKRSSVALQLRGAHSSSFPDLEQAISVLKDSATALFTLRLVDAWDVSQTTVVATRSFFAHCLRPGVRDIILLSDDESGFPTPYTLTCKINPMYSYFSQDTKQYVLQESVPRTLHIPSKYSMLQCVVIACRPTNLKLKLHLADPFVSIQVIGAPSDTREVRTGKCTRRQMNAAAQGLNSPAASSVSPNASSEGGNNSSESRTSPVAIGAVPSPLDGGDADNVVSWMFPLILTFTWSEFAFVRFALRSFASVDVENGVVYGGLQGGTSKRRSSIFGTKTYNASGPITEALNAGGAAAGNGGVGNAMPLSSASAPASLGSDKSATSAHVLGKNVLWTDSLRSGYRSIPLFSEKSPDQLVATLLCHFTMFDSKESTFGPERELPPWLDRSLQKSLEANGKLDI